MAVPPTLIQRITFLLISFIAALVLGLVLWPFWTQLVLAFLLASVFRPPYIWLLTRLHAPWAAACLTCLLITLCVFLPLLFCIGALSAEIPGVISLIKENDVLHLLQQGLLSNLMHRLNLLLAGLGMHIDLDRLPGLITDLSTTVGVFVYNQVSGWAANIVRFVLQFLLVIVGVFFLLIEFERLTNFLIRLSPLPEPQNRFLIDRFSAISGAILVGNSLSGLIQGVCGGLYFAALGLISPVLWGSVMAVVAFMPIVGIGLVLLPTALILALKGSGWLALATGLFYLALTFVVDYLFKPKFVGNQAKLPPLLVLLSILGGINLSGVMGIVYGPLALTAFFTLIDMYFLEYQPYFDHRDANGRHDPVERDVPGQGS
ncbi:MAG: AI-2E family transporter [Desulfobulbus sp.]|uniref:AI-2E family transporter n=1 Tax=Desulfobulbus sp. TaxID=895 RepID=UPI002844F31A|nr:AI-2E family transporter [Desulfobulbus sp.]MDR2551105.1 AI-2E family transporter [Desulfobulbus sp.]